MARRQNRLNPTTHPVSRLELLLLPTAPTLSHRSPDPATKYGVPTPCAHESTHWPGCATLARLLCPWLPPKSHKLLLHRTTLCDSNSSTTTSHSILRATLEGIHGYDGLITSRILLEDGVQWEERSECLGVYRESQCDSYGRGPAELQPGQLHRR